MSRHDESNHSNQMNPNNDSYWTSRGYEERPDDWETRIEDQDQELRPNQSSSNKK